MPLLPPQLPPRAPLPPLPPRAAVAAAQAAVYASGLLATCWFCCGSGGQELLVGGSVVAVAIVKMCEK
jgi:hypothetical protein